MMISKTHEKYKEIKSLLKGSKEKYITATDDLQVLEIALKLKLEIMVLLYSKEMIFKDETKKLLDSLIASASESYEISESAFKGLETKENHAGIVAKIRMKELLMENL